MSTVTVYGASDDLIEVEGDVPGCDEYNGEDEHFVLVGEEGKVRVRCWYTRRGIWAIAAAPVEENAPTLPVTIGGTGYTARATVEDVDLVIGRPRDRVPARAEGPGVVTGQRVTTGSEPRRCACCGEVVTRPNGDPWTGRLDAYCEECATTRCDAFPGECRRSPIVEPGHDEQTVALERATGLAEKYGEAIIRIGDILENTEPRGHLNRIRAVIAGLDIEERFKPSAPERGGQHGE